MEPSSPPPDDAASADVRRRPPIRRLVFLVVPAIAFVAVFWVYLARQADKPVQGSRAPEFTARYLGRSGSLSLSSLRGKPVVLNFWASWCDPCEKEAKLLEAASRQYAGRVRFVGIDTRDSRSDALAFVADHGVTYPQVVDEGERVYTQYGLTGQPESFFVDQNGIVVQHVIGALDSSDLYQYLDVLVSRNA